MENKILITILELMFGIGLLTSAVQAQEVQPLGFSVTESVFDLEIPAGGSYQGSVFINNGEKSAPTPIHIELSLWDLDEESDDIEFVTSELALNATKWFALRDGHDMILDTGQSREINFTISVPQDVSPGSYLVMMRLQTVPPEHYFSESGPRLVPEMGILFLIKVPLSGLDIEQKPYAAEIAGFEAGGANRISFLENILPNARAGVFDRAMRELTIKIKNDGIYFFKAKGSIEFKNVLGMTMEVVQLPERYLLSGKQRSIKVSLGEERPLISKILSELYAGPFSANLTLVTPDNQLISYSARFWALPWKAWTTLTLIITAVVLFFRRFGRRISLALHTLSGG